MIEILNERFGTDFTPADQLFFGQIQEKAVADDSLRQASAVNTMEDFRFIFEKTFENLVIDRMEGNEEIFSRLMGDSEFRKIASDQILKQVCDSINQVNEETSPAESVLTDTQDDE